MADVRRGVDRIDRQIVALLAQRFRYMDAAARIKPRREEVRDEARKAEVLAGVGRRAAAEGAPAEAIRALYDALVEASIAYELERFDAARA
jgi:isochorismate pyruvate lyase